MGENVFKVKIFGKEYPLSGDLDPKFVNELVELVNQKMHAIARELPLGSFQKVAVLCCLNLALELIILRKEKSKPDPEIEKRLQSLIEVIDQLQTQETATH